MVDDYVFACLCACVNKNKPYETLERFQTYLENSHWMYANSSSIFRASLIQDGRHNKMTLKTQKPFRSGSFAAIEQTFGVVVAETDLEC